MPWIELRRWLSGNSKGVEAPVLGEERPTQTCLLLGMLAEAQNRNEAALAWYKRAARLDGEVPGLLLVLARLAAVTGRQDEAIGYYRKALVERTEPTAATSRP
jgi:tetratricopeptide (TPR) repeat protein